MPRALIFIFALFFAACASKTPGEPPAAEEPAAPTTPAGGAAGECVAECERSRSMQAVSWEMIQAQCQRECAASTSTRARSR